MKIKSILMSVALLAGSLTASAQETQDFENVFQPHWYVGAQGGAQYTLGEVDFSDLLSPNAQVLVGYNFDKIFGVRLGVNAWQSKAGLRGNYTQPSGKIESFERKWKYNYVAPNIDLTMNLSNLFCGYNPNRLVNVGAFVGVGANIAFKNDEAQDVSAELRQTYPHWYGRDGQNLGHLWDGTKLDIQGRAGLSVDFRVSSVVSVGLEASANMLSDHYNSKHAPNADWYFNALAGVKINLGKTHTKKTVAKPEPQVIYKEKIVEKIVEKPVPVETPRVVENAREPLRVDVFFIICGTKPSQVEAYKIQEVIAYLNKYPDAKVVCTGYADKGTGSAAGNQRLSEKRAQVVVDELIKAGISPSRISSAAKGDTEQPFDINELNRVTICIAE